MWFSSWLHNRKRQRIPRPRSTFRPTLEALEDRFLPSSTSTVLTVTNTNDSGHGSLRYEIAQAEQSNGTDTIVFDLKKNDPGYNASTGRWTITLTSGELDITKSLNIEGPGVGQLAISAWYNTFRVFEVAANTEVSLSGMWIENGGAPGNATIESGEGGGILNHGGLTVSNCWLTGNVAFYDGGGIYNDGTLAVNNSFLGSNGTNDGNGGGIFNAGTLTVSNSTLDYNVAYVDAAINPSAEGGGIANYGTATVSDCQFYDNSANYGGGIYNGGTLTLSGSTFGGNNPDAIDGSYTDEGGNTFS